MPRPPMPLGTHGKIRVYPLACGGWKARSLYRDYDGCTRPVQMHGSTKAAAERRLCEAMRDRHRIAGADDITGDTRVETVAETWYEEVANENPSPNTLRIYRSTLDRHVTPALGRLRLRELTVGVLDRHLKSVAKKSGPGAAKTARTALSGICGVATRHDALERNLVREVGKVAPRKPKERPRALTVAESKQLRTALTYDDKAIERDIPDFADFLSATGFRIGEASAVVEEAVDLDGETVEVRGTVIRVKGKGLYIKPIPKSPSGFRKVKLPKWAVAMLRRRLSERHFEPGDVIFPAPRGGLRDPSNTQADLRQAFEAAGFDWATSKMFRRAVATMMDDAGLSGRQAADQLGHANPSMTSDNYMSRNIVADVAAPVLEELAI